MDTLCTLCHHWTPLPEHVPGGNGVHVRCAVCTNEIPQRGIAYRYRSCRLCGQHYLADLGRCPVCPAPGDTAGGTAWLTLLLDQEARPAGLGPAARDWVPLSSQYGLTLWAAWAVHSQPPNPPLATDPAAAMLHVPAATPSGHVS